MAMLKQACSSAVASKSRTSTFWPLAVSIEPVAAPDVVEGVMEFAGTQIVCLPTVLMVAPAVAERLEGVDIALSITRPPLTGCTVSWSARPRRYALDAYQDYYSSGRSRWHRGQ